MVVGDEGWFEVVDAKEREMRWERPRREGGRVMGWVGLEEGRGNLVKIDQKLSFIKRLETK